MYETIVFDLDGTLLDTLDDLTDATNAALEKFGLKSRTRDEVRSFVGNGIAKLIERAVGEDGKQYQAEALEEFKRHYAKHCADKTAPYEGILSLLQTLQAQGVKTAVVSNKADFAVKSLAKTYFDGLLLAAVGEDEAAGISKKPAPDSLLAVMAQLSATAENTVYVGDSEVDIQTAKNAGVDCICVTWGFRDKGYLMEEGGKLFVDAPAEILTYIKGACTR
ncbi:MAG: HAD family hydrolase [Clostridia bacterium]|nr:HAD family hydrolase [Clostridia bacterium]